MKRVSKLLLLVLGFSAGLLAGAFIRLGFEIINGRPVSIGGEALLLPLVILLICFGFSLGKEVRVQRNFSKAYEPVSYTHLVRGVLYTALTRARELLVIVGDDAAIRSMAANDRQQKRYSGLKWRLCHAGDASE